jgi:Tol biopolymer transport system component/serine/threonine protein kinase/formylglycine-generating enzyme required for sulfatase activity
MSSQDLTGHILGQYELRELLGRGGMGAVYRAYQRALKRAVAVKVLPAALAADPDFVARFTREAETAAALEHPHIIPVYDYGVEGGTSYIVMRLLGGGTLADRLAAREASGAPLPSLGEVAGLLTQLAGAFDYAHQQGVIHRDIKPSNIMFDTHGNAFLVDFGIAKLLEHTSALTATGAVLGTPLYMAPEQWRAEQPIPATDQYALGVTIYQLLTGQVPFQAPTPYGLMHKHLNETPAPPHTLRPNLPPALAASLERALAKSPAERFPSVTAFAQTFARAAAGQAGQDTQFLTRALEGKRPVLVSTPSPLPPPAPPPSATFAPPATPRPARPPGRGRVPLVWGALIALIVALGAAGLVLLGGGEEKQAPSATPSPTQVAAAPTETPTMAGGLTVLSTDTPTIPSPSATLTESPSATFTRTPLSPTATPTEPPTATPTRAGGLVILSTPTPTIPPPSATLTESPSATFTRTPLSPTATPTEPPTETPTRAGGLVILSTPTPTIPPATATPTPTPTPSATATPAPTLTPSPTPSPTATATATPDFAATAEALVAERLTQTAQSWTSTPTPTATATPDFAATVEAMAIAAMTATADAWTDTPTPTDTPTATRTPTPTSTPSATSTPIPTNTLTPTSGPVIFPPPPGATPLPVGSANAAWVPVVRDYRGIALVGVPPGCFMIGSAEGDADEKPVRRVCLSAYWIGQTEVTNEQYAACVSAGACAPPRDRTAFDNPALADHPVTWVSWFDAAAFAEWIGAALPTGAQWEFAARGPQGWTYPWGDDPPTCALANLERCTSGTSPVGQYPAGRSWVGALDLAGNAWEWVADYYGRDYYATLTDGTLDPLGPPFGDMHNVRGSSWENEARYARAYYQGGNYPDYALHSLGFRLAAPASLGETGPPTPTPASPPTPTLSGGGWGEIAFVSERDGNREIYVMSADGTSPRRLTNNRANDRDPAWSPDGMRIAFYSDREGNADIYVMGADGGGLRNLTNHPANDYHPSWSPDGARLAFNSDRGGSSDIYVINADGSGLARLTTPGTGNGGQAWSPDGTRIVFQSSRDGDDEIYVMNADGSGQTRLTFSPGNDGFPAWSPDGTQIAFQSNRDGHFDVYVINADGSGLRRLTTTGSNDWWPEWSADGTSIAFISDRDGIGAIYLMAADGSNPRRLTPLNSWSDSPAWRPAR